MEENITQTEKLVGIEVKHSEMTAVCLGNNGGISEVLKSPLDIAEDTAPQLIEFINETGRKFGNFDNLGIAVPGLYNRLTNKIAYSTYIPEHAEIDLLEEVEKVTKLNILIENDANAAAYGEFVLGAGRGSNDMFYATLGKGIGGALIFDKKLWYGATGFAGEFGQIVVNSEGMRLEDIASSANIIRRARGWFHKDATTSLNSVGEENITIADVVREANREDDFAQMMLERTGNYVGAAIAGVINLLNIEKIVIGGEIMEAGHLVLDAIIHRAKELSFAPSSETVEIVKGELSENASAIGVALLSDTEL
ncbi:MAG: ROK family protein [Aridibacter sp.]